MFNIPKGLSYYIRFQLSQYKKYLFFCMLKYFCKKTVTLKVYVISKTISILQHL